MIRSLEEKDGCVLNVTWLITNPLPLSLPTSVFGFLYLVVPLISQTDECKLPYPSDSTPAVAKVLFVCSWLHHLKDEKKKKNKDKIPQAA